MKLVVNGAEVEVDDRHAETPLLWVLRDVLGLRGTKFGCGAGFCAACHICATTSLNSLSEAVKDKLRLA